MSKYKIIRGNYIQVVDLLGFPATFYLREKKEKYLEQREKDIERLAYFSFKHTVSEMQTSLRNTKHIDDMDKPIFSWSQGSSEGTVFTEGLRTASYRYPEVAEFSGSESIKSVTNASHTLCVAYTDDDGNHCAFAISSLRDDPDPNNPPAVIPPIEERKRLFSVAIIKNTNLIPSERDVTFITDEVLMKTSKDAHIPERDHVSDIDAIKIPSEITLALNSKSLNLFLDGLIQDGVLSMKRFEVLKKRIRAGRNVDDWEQKLAQLKTLKELIEPLPENNVLLTDLNDLIEKFLGSEHSFKIECFESHKYMELFNDLHGKINGYLDASSADKDAVTTIRLASLAMAWKNQAACLENPKKIEILEKSAEFLNKLAYGNRNVREPYHNMNHEQLINQALRIKRRFRILEKFTKEQASLGYSYNTNKSLSDQIQALEDTLDSCTEETFNRQLKTISESLHAQFESELKAIIHALQEGIKKFPTDPEFIKSDVEREIQRLENFATATPNEQRHIKQKYGNRSLKEVMSDCIHASMTLELGRRTSSLRNKLKKLTHDINFLQNTVHEDNRSMEKAGNRVMYLLVAGIVAVILAAVLQPLALIGVAAILFVAITALSNERTFYKNKYKKGKEVVTSAEEGLEKLNLDLSAMNQKVSRSLTQIESRFIKSIEEYEDKVFDDVSAEPISTPKESLVVKVEDNPDLEVDGSTMSFKQ